MLQSNQMKFKGENKLLFFFQKHSTKKVLNEHQEQLEKIHNLEELLYKLL